MVSPEISYKADYVEAISEEFTPDYIVHGIYFGVGDPEQDGQHWNFSRTLETDDNGVCTVKEIQQVTIYGGIKNFVLSRNSVVCDFEEEYSEKTGTNRLSITFEISDEEWKKLLEKANLVFSGENYYEVK